MTISKQPPYVPGAPAPNWTTPPPAPPAKNRTLPVVISLAVVVLAAAGIGAAWLLGAWSDDATTPDVAPVVGTNVVAGPTLAEAVTACNPPGEDGVRLEDGGRSLMIDTKGDVDTDGATPNTLICAMEYLKAPGAVIEHMDSTRALDGRQTDSWAGFEAGWTYHPDDGVNMVIRQR
jgi:hypothetical protein